VDYGERRIGLAISDPTRTIATPLATLVRRPGKRPPWPEIHRLIADREVVGVVVVLPLELDGDEGEWAAEVRAFGDDFARRSGLPIDYVDERLSSVQAERAVRGIGLSRSQREDKSRVDAAAAAVLLQRFLDRSTNAPHVESD
jgi:putative holliday junction resolvase